MVNISDEHESPRGTSNQSARRSAAPGRPIDLFTPARRASNQSAQGRAERLQPCSAALGFWVARTRSAEWARQGERSGSVQSTRGSGPRRGLTLLELLLVLALLVGVAALSLPAVGPTLDNHYLRGAGELVRVHWAKARVQAMQTGRTVVFRYEPAGRLFVVEPWITADDYLESSDPAGVGIPSAAGTGVPQAVAVEPRQEELPERVSFLGSEVTLDTRAALISEGVAGAPRDAGLSPLSPPIFFYADGTTSTARLILGNERGRYVTIHIRGLTGRIQVSRILSEQDVQELRVES